MDFTNSKDFLMKIKVLYCFCLFHIAVYGEEYFCNKTNGVTRITGETTGVITTLREGQSSYRDNEECLWVVDAGVGNSIKFTVNYVDLEWAPSYTLCTGYDNLEMLEGVNKQGTQLASLCGRSKGANPYQIISMGHQAYLRFSTSHQHFSNRRGIQMKFEIFPNNTCPPDWIVDRDECFMLGDKSARADWETGQIICAYSQANLFRIESMDQATLISDAAKDQTIQEAWVGLSDRVKEGSFKWLGGFPISYSRNIVGNSEENDCVAEDFQSGEWKVHSCTDEDLNYICKRKKDGSTIVYSAFPNSASPEDGGKPNAVVIAVAICLGVVGVLAVVITIYCVYLRRKRRKNPNQHQRHASVPSSSNDNTTPPPAETRRQYSVSLTPADPSAPGEDLIQIRSQLVAPPTYEESKYDRIVPALY